ncbi:MAG: hypothetical protein A3G34_04180 [Candidatus Lindowbacteria bacterium RIFCSPLOWO2_12_FULL_62_27]|nr:MAG: hypothetical protein A3G34_04180 [Candidatus Lindowbacteria bacterium RIFCSPLOWO2_12_FULL_62_27]
MIASTIGLTCFSPMVREVISRSSVQRSFGHDQIQDIKGGREARHSQRSDFLFVHDAPALDDEYARRAEGDGGVDHRAAFLRVDGRRDPV